jgi:hypothetical protein
MTEHITLAEYRRTAHGSHRAHEGLVEAVRYRLSLAGIPVFTIYTGGIPRFEGRGPARHVAGLTRNQNQIGFGDLFFLCFDPEHLEGRAGIIECKTGQARRKPGQIKAAKLFVAHGQLALLVRRVEEIEPIIAADREARRILWQRKR